MRVGLFQTDTGLLEKYKTWDSLSLWGSAFSFEPLLEPKGAYG